MCGWLRGWCLAVGVMAVVSAGAEASRVQPPPWPVLTADERTQVETATDGTRPDGPALYPLLLHMRGWDRATTAAVVAAGGESDRRQVLTQPGLHRGQVVVLDGRFAGRERGLRLLRPGPWGREVTEWGLVGDPPAGRGRGATGVPGADAERAVSVVLFPVGPGELERPRGRQRVRVAARFLKLWEDVDAEGVARTYPVFVAAPHWVPVEGDGGANGAVRWMVPVVLGLVLGWGVLRRVLGGRRRAGLAGRVRGGGDAVDEAEGLPEDPAEALGVLAGRGERGDCGSGER